jgi:CDP-paratose 2-epimerase
MKAMVTGSGGLIGSECVKALCGEGWSVIGVDNDMRRRFFGDQGATGPVVQELLSAFPEYRHTHLDIRDRQGVRELLQTERPDFIIHTAAQPSHDKAASIPYDDFDVNAGGTMNLLVAARDYCPESPFCFTSTNKVYGDRPNYLPLVEKETRYDYADGLDGIDESMSIDACLHSLFGASKTAADVMCQEFGRYFQMPVGIFRGGCLTGPQHAAVELHGYLGYIVHCAVAGKPYAIYGYKGKQVRDQIHCRDVANLFLNFYRRPRCGEVYNLGGGRQNSLSILETVELLAGMGLRLRYEYVGTNRKGDHICYISDLSKVKAHFPEWRIEYDLKHIIPEMVKAQAARA